jgi:DNA-binding transcriptional regulator YiaG
MGASPKRGEPMRQTRCSECGSIAKVTRGTYQFKESGLDYVYLKGIDLIKCHDCGTVDPIIPHINELMRVVAFALIARHYRLGGEEVRFLRKFLGKTATQFSALLSVDATTISKWENNDDPVGEQSDRLIRTVVLAMDDKLKEKLREVIKSFPKIEKKHQDDQLEINPSNMSYQYA